MASESALSPTASTSTTPLRTPTRLSGINLLREADVDRELSQWQKELLKERLACYSDDIANWITAAVAYDPAMPVVHGDNFSADIRSGVPLLRLARAIENGETKWRQSQNMPPRKPFTFHIREDATPGSWKARDNIAQFVAWARHLGLPEVVLFETSDVADAANLRQVLHCLIDVARLQRGIDPPRMIQMELQLDRALAGDVNMTGSEEDLTPLIKEMLRELNMAETLADQRDELGRYYFGRPTSVFVRRLGQHLMVPLDDDWITLKHYLRLLEGGRDRELERINKRLIRRSATERDLKVQEEQATSKAEEVAQLNDRVQQLRVAHEKSTLAMAEKERELQAAQQRLEEAHRLAEQAEREAAARLERLENEKQQAAAMSDAALKDALARLEEEQARQADARRQREETAMDGQAQVDSLQRGVVDADQRVNRLSQILEDEVHSKEELLNELNQTNEKLREMRQLIAQERFGRAAEAGLADARLKALEAEREEHARDASRLRELEKARDEAQRRADAMEAVATEVVVKALNELATLETVQNNVLQKAAGPEYDLAQSSRSSVVYDVASKTAQRPTRRRLVLKGVREVVTVTRTKHFSDGREPVRVVERTERLLTEDEIKSRHLEEEAKRLYEEQKKQKQEEQPVYATMPPPSGQSSQRASIFKPATPGGAVDADTVRQYLRKQSANPALGGDSVITVRNNGAAVAKDQAPLPVTTFTDGSASKHWA